MNGCIGLNCFPYGEIGHAKKKWHVLSLIFGVMDLVVLDHFSVAQNVKIASF